MGVAQSLYGYLIQVGGLLGLSMPALSSNNTNCAEMGLRRKKASSFRHEVSKIVEESGRRSSGVVEVRRAVSDQRRHTDTQDS